VGRNILQDVANTLPHMIMSERMGRGDLETLAELPDGSLQIDLLTSAARHSAGETVSLQVLRDLANWLNSRLGSRDQVNADLAGAELEFTFRTDAVP
jgi:hypothetical protein